MTLVYFEALVLENERQYSLLRETDIELSGEIRHFILFDAISDTVRLGVNWKENYKMYTGKMECTVVMWK